MFHRVRAGFSRISGFIRRQKPNYRVGMMRAAATSFLASLISQYSAIFAVGLGANSVQLGSLSSVGSAISALISAPVGWLVDRRGVKLFVLVGLALAATSALFYAVAFDWRLLIVSALLAAVATRLIGTSSSVICVDSVQNQDRATAQNVCATLSAIAAIASPLIAAYLVTAFGGMNVEGIRPLYYIQVGGYALIFIFIAVVLREPQFRRVKGTVGARSFFKDFGQLFTKKPVLIKWIFLSGLNALPMAMY